MVVARDTRNTSFFFSLSSLSHRRSLRSSRSRVSNPEADLNWLEMENPESAQSVRVAVNIRPLITSELMLGCTDCISVVPGEPQVQIGSHAFTYDYVYGSTGSRSSAIYDDCVAPLVDALFNGYNATVLAYGQTGSGKTYTMGTNYTGEENAGGIIPKVMETIFKRVQAMKESSEFLIRVSFIEIFKEEVFDLLDPNSARGEAAATMKAAAPSRVPIQIRETLNGGITLAGVTEAEVKTKEEMSSYLSRGSLSRATGIDPNIMHIKISPQLKLRIGSFALSSRSHAIFTITMEQKSGDDVLCAKLHLVDLAGSERAKRTGADGMRLKEGIHINKGLLALGNVISALGDERKRKEGGHVPYRDSKLTRLLQDSLGGNSKTVMIACVSPADTNAEETLNTLKYANRARNIQNKAVVNRDPVGAQMQIMRSQIEQLQSELLFYRGDAGGAYEELQILKHKISLLEASNAELQQELQERRVTCESLSQRACDAQVEKDQLIMKIESIRNGKSWDEIESNSNQDYDLVKSYVSKIQEMEGELQRLKNSNTKSRHFVDWVDSDDNGFQSKNALFPCGNEYSSDCDAKVDITDEEDHAKEIEHSSLQEKLDRELKELDKKLEQKEAEMKKFNNADTSVLKQHFEKKVLELEQEKKILQKEIEELRYHLANISSTSDDGAQQLKEKYLQKLNALEAQLKKEGRRNEYEMHKLLALNQRQKMVLQRKTEEASLATKRLKELLESRKTSSRETTGGHGPGIQALMQAIEHELEVTVRVHEVRSAHERQMEERAKMAKEIARLKEEADMMKLNNSSDGLVSMSPGARNSRIYALEKMIASSSTTLLTMASQLSEAEERERVFSGKGRWNQVRTLAEAKNLMNHLFNLASSSRCSLRDREVACREKDMEIRDLKEKVVKLSYSLRQLEMHKSELIYQLKFLSAKRYSESVGDSVYDTNGGGHKYDLRKMENRRSTILMEDMDLSVSDTESDDYVPDATDDDWVESEKTHVKKRKSRSRRVSMEENQSNMSSEDVKDNSTEGHGGASAETASEICCSCSKASSCKTNKCKCRAMGGSCGSSCGCLSSKCANRASVFKESQVEGTGNDSSIEDANRDRLLAAQGAELLHGALVDGPADAHSEHGPRKPLSDIGNTLAKSNAQKTNPRKKWGKVKPPLLVVTDPPPSSAVPKKEDNNNNNEANLCMNISQKMHSSGPENALVVPKVEKNVIETDIPLKIPRAMRKQVSSNGGGLPLGDMNACKPDESVNKKESEVIQARSPVKQKRTLEKENNGR
ncbi:hypothetical protein Fmac_031498 [Flemingia macrophylla]|uniref:Kinesin motor domain-containing protein n=1 Tax=Flemingia macrophylla TaxID=520843 RepID=A0ABD1L277_9FABA